MEPRQGISHQASFQIADTGMEIPQSQPDLLRIGYRLETVESHTVLYIRQRSPVMS